LGPLRWGPGGGGGANPLPEIDGKVEWSIIKVPPLTAVYNVYAGVAA
jgi:hypothetical protein